MEFPGQVRILDIEEIRIKGGGELGMLRRLLLDEDGQTMTEYILIIALVAIALIAIIKIFGKDIAKLFKKASGKLQETEEMGEY